MTPRGPALPHVVLIGGGHTHVQVLRRHRQRPFAARLSIVLDHPEAVYSGMVPGVVAGQYRPADVTIDVWALARTAGVRVIDGAALRIDTERGRVEVADHAPIAFDAASVDIGSTVAGLDLPGVRAHALATRPIGRFVAQVDARLAAAPDGTLVVVGTGAAGIELAWCLRARTGRPVTLIGQSTPTLAWLQARRPGQVAHLAARVAEVTADGVVLTDGTAVPAALTVWATGAAAHPLAEASGLPHTDGYLRVGPTLQVEGHPRLYAAGDCARVVDPRSGRPVPKAGVYAVREGPVLCANLDARLSGTDPAPYRPQADFLRLLNLGDGRALAQRYGRTVEGAWAWRLKDRIDRRFMAMFAVLDDADRPVADAMGGPMPAEDMVCGGCAAKVGPAELHRALGALPPAPPDPSVLVGLGTPDDAAIVDVGGARIGLTVDAFTAFCDDPWVVGRVAAVNALNDLYVKGIAPRWALAMLSVPDEPGVLDEVMAGVRATLDAEGVSLVGGHTVRADTLTVGLSVTGVVDGPVAVGAPRPGDALVLTRGLGTGVLLRANGLGRARGAWVQAATRWMARSHRAAAAVLAAHGVTVATDVTGFGLYGHLAAVLTRAPSEVPLGARVRVAELPLHAGVASLYLQGVRSTFHAQNARGLAGVRLEGVEDHALAGIGFDPQTAGPLLFAVAADRAQAVIAALAEVGEPARVVGEVTGGAHVIRLEAG